MKRIFILCILLLLLSGCGVGGRFFKGRTDNLETYNFRTGTEGIAMSWVEGMPPNSVYTGTDFSVAVKLENKGAFDVKDRSEVRITVPDIEAFKFSGGDRAMFVLAGKSLYVKEGQQDVKSFPLKSQCIPFGAFRKNYTASIQATACYYYETTAQADICIDTLFYKRQKAEKAECAMAPVSMSGGQGGPVGVTTIPIPQIIESQGKVTAQISIPIQKLLRGTVAIFNPDNACTDPRKLDQVAVEVSLGGKIMACKPVGTLALREAEPTSIVCSIQVDAAAGAYKTPVLAKMKYYVQHKLVKNLLVNPEPGKLGKDVDCRPDVKAPDAGTDAVKTGGIRGDCTAVNPGYSCRDISAVCPTLDNACIEGQGCKYYLCSNPTDACCP